MRWYSPRDWIEGDEDTPSPGSSPQQQLPEEGGVAAREEGEAVKEEEEVGVAGEEESEVGVAGEEGTEVGVSGEGQDDDGDEEVKSKPPLPSRLAMQERAWSGDNWAEDGWGQDDWDVIIGEDDDSATVQPNKQPPVKRVSFGVYVSDDFLPITPQFVKGHLSDRMLQPNNVWVETWQSATPLPAYRQKRIFDDTKEAEKVLHFFSHLKPSELAMALMPMLLHAAALRLQHRLRTQPLARVEGILQDALSLLATIQQPSLDSLPLYQVKQNFRLMIPSFLNLMTRYQI